jgi:hypothetical protein
MQLSAFEFLFAAVLLLLLAGIGAFGQDAAQRTPGDRTDQQDDQPRTVRETMVKMRIDEEKKEYNEMLDRSKQAQKLSEELERDFAAKNELTKDDYDRLANLEKLVKKIRGTLGAEGSDLGDSDDDEDAIPKNPADAMKALGSFTSKLVDELSKTSRFSVSVAAIQSTNAVLKVCRFLRGSK